jgi:hypothetical protein
LLIINCRIKPHNLKTWKFSNCPSILQNTIQIYLTGKFVWFDSNTNVTIWLISREDVWSGLDCVGSSVCGMMSSSKRFLNDGHSWGGQ